MEEYEKECAKRKGRAEKFGTTYVPPDMENFLPWTEVKRLRTKTTAEDKGFATGIDLMDSEELAKQEARKARFAQKSADDGTADEAPDSLTEAGTTESTARKTVTTIHQMKDLPVIQCWDKIEMLGPQRSDPPSSLWIRQNDVEVEASTADDKQEEQRQEETTTHEPTLVPEKIHLFAIDWAAFKQIRNNDLMAYFTGYGPTYVEWLGDLSCNVCFGDQFTAKRALTTLTQEIPSPPPEELNIKAEGDDNVAQQSYPDLGNMTWRFCRRSIRKVRGLQRRVPAFIDHRDLTGKVCADDCVLVQICDDKHGRKGTTARVLMRSALSTDILQDRPNAWPAPPGGFSSKNVLGPDSDYSRKKRQKRNKNKKKRQRAEKTGDPERASYTPHIEPDGEHPMLARGLSSGRDGFSLEAMEQERAKKRAKTIESGLS